MSDDKPLPKHLYKYRTWSNPLHKRIITHNEIYFASPRWFNDPFDCRILMGYRELSRDQLLQEWIKIIQMDGTEEEKTNYLSLANDKVELLLNAADKQYDGLMEMRQRQSDAGTGIFSTSSICDDILMWSHYSDSHMGLCVELDYEKLSNCVTKLPKRDGVGTRLYKVLYEEKYPMLMPIIMEGHSDWIKQLLVKSDRWDYEDEWRLIAYHDTDFTFQLDSGIITKIIMGCEMPDSDQEEIKHELYKQGGSIALAKAVKKKDEFGLKIVPVDY